MNVLYLIYYNIIKRVQASAQLMYRFITTMRIIILIYIMIISKSHVPQISAENVNKNGHNNFGESLISTTFYDFRLRIVPN